MSSNVKLYEQVADKIKAQVDRGVLGPGQRVPSVRQFSRQLGVSVFTVVQAYWVLENRGTLESRPGSGFYVRPSDRVPPTDKVRIPGGSSIQIASAKQVKARVRSFDYLMAATTDPENLYLSMGFPGLAVMPLKNLQRSLRVGGSRIGHKAFEYNWPFGHGSLRRQLARHYFDCGLEVSSDQVVLTSGCVESLNVAYRMVIRPGDIVAVESPSIFTSMCLQQYQVKVLEVPSDPRTGMDLDILERVLKKYPVKACVAFPNFKNPGGSLMPDANKKRLVEMLARKGATLIENDIYGDIHFGKVRPRPAKAFDRSGNVLLVSSFSKVLAPGVRVGWLIVGKNIGQALLSKFMATTSTNGYMEAGLAHFMEQGDYVRHLRKVRNQAKESLTLLRKKVLEYFPEGTRINQPEGGVTAWVELPEKVDANRIHQEALDRKILVYPGPSFFLTPRFKNCLSLGFGNLWSEPVEKGIQTLGELAKRQMTDKK